MLLLVKTPLHPPAADAVANQAAYAASTAAWVWHAAAIMLTGQEMDGAGGAVTVKVAWQAVVSGVQLFE